MSDWLKQANEALFPDLIWGRPENKRLAGKLLIVGGNAHGFMAPSIAYAQAEKAGIGDVRLLLPVSLKANVGPMLPEAFYAPANKSGSFARESLAELIDQSAWADLSLLAGDFGHNSETAITLETFVSDFHGPLTLAGDALDPFLLNPLTIIDRQNTLFVAPIARLQKFLTKAKQSKAITANMTLAHLVDYLNELTATHASAVITSLDQYFVVSLAGRTSTTAAKNEIKGWPVSLASHASVWWLQNKDQVFEGLTSAIYDFC